MPGACTFTLRAAHISSVQQITTKCDDKCREILTGFRSGLTNDHETRRLIAAELYTEDIAGAVAKEGYLPSAQAFVDLKNELNNLLYSKVMGEGSSALNLNVPPATSIPGWARQLLRRARSSEQRNIDTRTTARFELVDPQPQVDGDRIASAGTARFHREATLDAYDPGYTDQMMTDAVDWLQSKTRHLRDNSKLEAHAATLRHGYGVPSLIRPRVDERDRLRALLAADPFVAHRSVRLLRASLAREEHEPVVIDQGLLALWDDFSYENLEAIAFAPAKVAKTLVEAVLADRPRPPRTTLRSFRVASHAFGSGKGWVRLIDEACECFVALEFEAYSAFDTTGTDFRDQRLAGRVVYAKKAVDVFARVLAWPGQTLGRTEDEMYERLDGLIRSMADLEVEVQAA